MNLKFSLKQSPYFKCNVALLEYNLMNLQNFFTTNTWWGKVIGGFLGFLMHGPTGALIGILVGNLFDKGLATHFTYPNHFHQGENRQNVQTIFFQATFMIMGHIAKLDGHISENEIKIAQQIMTELRLDKNQKIDARLSFNTGKKANFNLDAMLGVLQTTCYDNPELLKLFVNIQYRAAQVEGLSTDKINRLNYIFRRLGFIPLNQQYRFYEDFGYQHSRSSDSKDDKTSNDSSNQQHSGTKFTNNTSLAYAYALLGINETASHQEVKRAYRRLISLNHPDKLIAQGLPEKKIKIANDKTQNITKAYQQICAYRGW
jgi:DnaJ like chaperone protein